MEEFTHKELDTPCDVKLPPSLPEDPEEKDYLFFRYRTAAIGFEPTPGTLSVFRGSISVERCAILDILALDLLARKREQERLEEEELTATLASMNARMNESMNARVQERLAALLADINARRLEASLLTQERKPWYSWLRR